MGPLHGTFPGAHQQQQPPLDGGAGFGQQPAQRLSPEQGAPLNPSLPMVRTQPR